MHVQGQHNEYIYFQYFKYILLTVMFIYSIWFLMHFLMI